jgi:CheY-like chemotaxis protein
MQKPRLLIVDDIFVNRMLLAEIANEIGCECATASNGKEAIQKLHSVEFDLILMDIEMPVMNGLETTRYIRSEFDSKKSKTPIVAMTAHNPSDFFDEYSSAGFDELVTKPYLISKIQKLVENYCTHLA